VITWDVPFPAWACHAELTAWLRGHGVRLWEGGHTVYLPPQDALRTLIGPLVDFYPPNSGFKILKDCRHPQHARYLHKHRRTLPLLVRMIGSPRDQLVPANYLYANGLGPRVWDLTAWASGGSRCTVFVVAHVAGRGTTASECDGFLARLNDLQRSTPLRVLIPDWERNDDFRSPDCNGNLRYSVTLGRAQYVDFQNFGLTRAAECDRRFTTRCTRLADLLRDYPVDLAGRLVLDPACRDGASIAASLTRGAAWGVAWCRGDDATAVETSLLATGFTRFTIVRDDPAIDVHRGVPSGLRDQLRNAVAFWDTNSSLRLDQLMRLPCETLVCDGDRSATIWSLRNLSAAQGEPPAGRAASSPLHIVRRGATHAPAARP
jgi:hypothetical protein